jgi:hypothetical protein
MMFYHDGGVFFQFVEALELQVADSEGVDGCYRKHFSCKEGVLAFGVTPKVFSPC